MHSIKHWASCGEPGKLWWANEEALKTGCRGINRKQRNPLHWSSIGGTGLTPFLSRNLIKEGRNTLT